MIEFQPRGSNSPKNENENNLGGMSSEMTISIDLRSIQPAVMSFWPYSCEQKQDEVFLIGNPGRYQLRFALCQGQIKTMANINRKCCLNFVGI